MDIIAAVVSSFLIGQGMSAPTVARSKVEQRLAELLTPSGQVGPVALPGEPSPRKVSPSIGKPNIPSKLAIILPPAPPKPRGKPAGPRMLPAEPPLVRAFHQPVAPQAVTLATTPLVRLWSWNIDEPLPLPILGFAVRDRASLADVSLPASVAAAQAKLNPARTQPAPFQPQNLPDPFENRHAVRLRHPPEENAQPPLSLLPPRR